MTPTACRTRTSEKKEEAGSTTGRSAASSPSSDSRSFLSPSWNAQRPCQECPNRSYIFPGNESSTNRSIAERLAGFELVANAFLRFLLAAERDERFAFEIEYVLFADHLRRGQRSSREDIRELAANVRVILRSVSAAQHHVDRQLCGGEKLLAQHFDLRSLRAFLPARRQRLVPAAHQRQGRFFCVRNQPVAVHGDAIFAAQIAQLAALFSDRPHFRHGNGFEHRLQRVK